ncbi:MAG TPA: RNA polymerase sigma factor [Kofleriaceae bacterium]|nr:RNA polymerase sigma factor [Kofleriaceae bacterium]
MQSSPPTKQDEVELLAAWRAGDKAAGQRLFRQSYKVVSRYFRNKVGGVAHGDLVQRTFLACLRSAEGFRGASSFRTYLLRIAHHTLVDHYRAARRDTARGPEHELDLDDVVVADAISDPDAVVTRRQEHKILLAALRRLPLALQVVLELRYWEALTDREIAEVLGAPLGTVKTRLRDGHLRLREVLARGDVSPDLLRSTMDTLDSWSQRVRGGLDIFDEVSDE